MNNYIEYLKRYATARQISEGEAETHKTVQEVKAYCKEKDTDKPQETRVNVGCGGAKSITHGLKTDGLVTTQ